MLKLSDVKAQTRLETIFEQLGWVMTGRNVSERDTAPPMVTYWLTHETPLDMDKLLGSIPGEYGVARDADPRLKGMNAKLILSVRQLVPTQIYEVKEFGRNV